MFDLFNRSLIDCLGSFRTVPKILRKKNILRSIPFLCQGISRSITSDVTSDIPTHGYEKDSWTGVLCFCFVVQPTTPPTIWTEHSFQL